MPTADPVPSTLPAPVEPDEEPRERPAVPAGAELIESERLVESELLVEDVSIDGMCGVY